MSHNLAPHQKRTTTTTGNTMSKTISFSDDPDSFIIGDRVWVQGTKPGYIVYIGEVQFAKGEWAGVVLDHPEGKNDGSVHGVRYFQCPPNRGLFTRLHRLSRYPVDMNNNISVSPSPPPKIVDEGKSSIAQPNIHHQSQSQPQQNIRTHRIYTTDGNKITTTVTRVTKTPANVPHYALPIKPTQVITTVTTTTTTVEKPKSVLKSSCRVTSSQNTNSADKLRSQSTNPVHHVHF